MKHIALEDCKILKTLQCPTKTLVLITPAGVRDTVRYHTSDEGYAYYVGANGQVYYRESK